MKVTIINGSPRKNGSTFKILKFFKESLEIAFSGINIEFFNLIDFNIKYCIGCQNCYRTGKCVFLEDGIEEIHDIIKNSNAIIFGSPTYASNVSGLYKSFHDRIHITMEHLLYKKPCINITTYENAMGNKTLGIMKEMVMNAGGYNVGSIAIKNTFNKDPLSDKNKIKIKKLALKLIHRIQINKHPMISKIYSKIAINIFLKPFVYKNKENNQGIINSWKELKIIENTPAPDKR
ncbi:MAG: flavodoxin family protein [Treponema sp.]|nr:flavodoxin family protein [Treponema sp.]